MDQQAQAAIEKQNPHWFGKGFDTGVERLSSYPQINAYITSPEVVLILGARRTGKSTLLYQIISTLKAKPESMLFINLDEPLFQTKADDPSFLTQLIEGHMIRQRSIKKFHVFIDEVQNYTHWASAIKTMHDTNKNIKFILTGSTSTLLKNAMSTKLSGRYLHATIYPLSFREYLKFTGAEKLPISEKRQRANDYLQFGAFPRIALEKNEALRQEILKNYFNTIYLKDIIYPHKLRSNKDVFDLLYFIISNTGKPFSYTSIGKALGIATETVQEYIAYAEDAYMIYPVNKFDYSLKKQLANPKKVYCIDTGMANAISFRFSENRGRLMENLVYMTLKRRYDEIYYHKKNHECDFLVKEKLKVTKAIQATISMQDETVRKRELKGIVEAMDEHALKEGEIVTENESEKITVGDKTITVKPLYAWLEENS